MVENPALAAVHADIEGARFRLGVKRGYWRVVDFKFPLLTVAVAATEPDGSASEYGFRVELSNFPGVAPEARIWDLEKNQLLAANKRPSGSERVCNAFKVWGKETVYRPWDRQAATHNNWHQTYANSLWHSKRDLAFILEDLYEVLNLNPRA